MNDYKISDYSIFSNATSTTNKLIEKHANFDNDISTVKSTISNSAVFMGPASDKCGETLAMLSTEIKSISGNFNTINNYLNSVSSSYKNGDSEALSALLETTSSTNAKVESSGKMTTGTVSGQLYNITATKGDALEYANHIDSKNIAETKNLSKYSDHCLGFSYTHAWGLYTNNKSYTAEDGKNYKGATHFTQYTSNNKKEFLSKVYDELSQNKPVILQVNGNKKGTSRHYVTAIGYKNSVKSASELKESDLLIIDSYDGKLETMDTNNSRFLVTGKACNKDYSGYQLYRLK